MRRFGASLRRGDSEGPTFIGHAAPHQQLHLHQAIPTFRTHSGTHRATLGVVSGRRRQGKTYLLEAACPAAGGFYFGATEATDTESLRRISIALTEHLSPSSPFHFADWTEAVSALLGLGRERPVPVVLDEFPYLVKANSELPSIIQQAEPLITFYHAVMRPAWSLLERPGNAARVWRASGQQFSGKVLGPRFEEICCAWALNYADPDRLGGLPAQVTHGVLTDAASKSAHEVDVVVTGLSDGKAPLLAIGEAKWGETMGTRHLERLRHIRNLIGALGKHDTSGTALMCFSAAGFTSELRSLAEGDTSVILVDAEELYGFPSPRDA